MIDLDRLLGLYITKQIIETNVSEYEHQNPKSMVSDNTIDIDLFMRMSSLVDTIVVAVVIGVVVVFVFVVVSVVDVVIVVFIVVVVIVVIVVVIT